jgi:hypothetical protein
MNPLHHSLADRLASLFSVLPQVVAVAVGGSQGSGTSDAASDIDLYVYTRSDIPLEERRLILERAGGASRANLGLAFWGPGDEWVHAASGIEVDGVYFDAAWMDSQVRQTFQEHQARLGYSTCFAYTICHSQVFYDPEGWFAALQAASRVPYPEPLRRKIIALNHPLLRGIIPAYTTQIEKAVQRADLVSINHRMAALFASYFDILFAINRELHPGEKRLVEHALACCGNLPVDMARDIEEVLAASSSCNLALLDRLDTLLDHLDDLLAGEGFDPQTSPFQIQD